MTIDQNKTQNEINKQSKQADNKAVEKKKIVYKRLFSDDFHKELSDNLKRLGKKPMDNPLLTPEYYAELRRKRLFIQSLPYEKIKRKWWYFSDKTVMRYLKYSFYIYITYKIFMWLKGIIT